MCSSRFFMPAIHTSMDPLSILTPISMTTPCSCSQLNIYFPNTTPPKIVTHGKPSVCFVCENYIYKC